MSATKRRAGAAASPELSTPDPVKRRKRNDDNHFPDTETVHTTIDTGGKLMRLLKKSKDKNGREIANDFLELPNRDEIPQYYVQVKMPLSLNMIETRLVNGKYNTLEKLESDLKRLIQNAKEFNSTKSEIYEDAERLRKAMSNFMPKHNPAYSDPNYRAYPTPIPPELLERDETPKSAAPSEQPEKIKLKLTNNNAARRQSRGLSTENGNGAANDETATAQLRLLDELSAQPDAPNFEEKPSRTLKVYYQIITRPTSVSDVRKMIQQGKLKDWNTFASEVRLIWSNAKEFNEDDSEIYAMAEELEEWFEERVQALGASPPAKIKLNIKRSVTLKLSNRRGASIASGGGTDGETAQKDSPAEFQAQSQRAGSRLATADALTPAPADINRGTSLIDSRPPLAARPISNQSGSILAARQGLNQVNGQIAIPTLPHTDMPPQPQFVAVPTVNGNHPQQMSYTHKPPNFFAESDNPIERKYRDPGKGLDDALLSSVTFMTHPDLQKNPRWKIERYGSESMTQTSSYIYLPSSHYYLRVIPRLSTECRDRKIKKLTVCRNWEQVRESRDTPGAYDFRIHPGENVIAVDVIASLAEGDSKPYAPPQLQIDFERITLTIVLRGITPE